MNHVVKALLTPFVRDRVGAPGAGLFAAAAAGESGPVTAYLDHAGHVDLADDAGRTLLLEAAKGGHNALCLLLLKRGANINARDANGTSALMTAAREGRLDTVRLLLDRGARTDFVNRFDHSALTWAIKWGQNRVACELLGRGFAFLTCEELLAACLNAVQANDHAYLAACLKRENLSSARLPLGLTLLMAAALAKARACAELLLAAGADPDATDGLGKTALMLAAAEGDQDMARLLLAAGADPKAADIRGETVADHARKTGHAHLLELFGEARP